LANLIGNYEGGCKKGFANGEGEAVGIHHYKGSFTNGLPNGKGTYYYDNNFYYVGNFQDGIKEGKGELHYKHTNLPDSVIKGYWSGDECRGAEYKTYNFITSETFASVEIVPTVQSGNSVTIDLSTTSGAPDGTRTTLTGKLKYGFVLGIADIFSTNGCVITKLVSNGTTTKSSYKYMLSKFPAELFITLSNGRTVELNLYKSAKWNVRLYLNQ
jgi:hypothetical protein